MRRRVRRIREWIYPTRWDETFPGIVNTVVEKFEYLLPVVLPEIRPIIIFEETVLPVNVGITVEETTELRSGVKSVTETEETVIRQHPDYIALIVEEALPTHISTVYKIEETLLQNVEVYETHEVTYDTDIELLDINLIFLSRYAKFLEETQQYKREQKELIEETVKKLNETIMEVVAEESVFRSLDDKKLAAIVKVLITLGMVDENL